MKFSTIASALALAAPAIAAPVEKRDAALDLTVLQFALTLEHLEDYFYSHALRRIPRSQFFALGFDQTYYDNLKRITDDEKSHVALLSSAISSKGVQPVLECDYFFGVDFDKMTAKDFITISSIIEGVGTSAYLGGAPLIESKDYLTVAGSILVTEALHTSYQRNAVKEVPFATPYGTPLDPTSVYTLASAFIIPGSCPKRSPPLPFTANPSFNVTSATPAAQGSKASFVSSIEIPAGSYATFISGLTVESVPLTITGKTATATIPTDVAGQVYVLVTAAKSTGDVKSAGKVIAGPAIVEVIPPPPSFLN